MIFDAVLNGSLSLQVSCVPPVKMTLFSVSSTRTRQFENQLCSLFATRSLENCGLQTRKICSRDPSQSLFEKHRNSSIPTMSVKAFD